MKRKVLQKTNNIIHTVANFLSNAFNGYIALAATLWIGISSQKDLITNYLYVFSFSIFLLFSHIYILRKLDIVSDWEISDRGQRPKYALSATIPYFFILLFSLNSRSQIFISISLLLLSLNIIFGFISIFWKISGHMIYLSIFSITLYILFGNFIFLLLCGIITLLVGWSRIYLKRHTLLQVIFGITLGVILPLIFL